MMQTASVAPDEFAKTSNKSPFLVSVNNACAISMAIPNKTENTNAITKGLTIVELLNSFLKKKNHSNVKPK